MEERERGTEDMKIKPIYLIALGLALALTVSVCKGLKTTDKYSKLVGQYEEAARVAAADAKLKDALIAEKVKVIAALDKKIADSTIEIGQLTNLIGQRDVELDRIRYTWANLSVECQAKLHELDATWSAKFSLLEGVVAEQDKQISAWAGKYDAQITISESWKAKYEGANRLLTISQALNKSLTRKVKTGAIIGNIKTGAVVAAAGWIIFNAIKGK
jgi:hypothetical protein